jgi:hypothetical protein
LLARLQGSSYIALLVYVDDIVIASNDPNSHQSHKFSQCPIST